MEILDKDILEKMGEEAKKLEIKNAHEKIYEEIRRVLDEKWVIS